METTQTNLRQSKTKVELEGILSSKKLEESKNDKGINVIKGNLVLKIDDINSISVGVYIAEKTSKGEINKAYDGIKTVMNEYKPIADVGEEAADRVHTNADFNTYKNQNNMDVVSYRSNFFTRINRALDPKRKFTAEVFIKSKTPEMVNGEPSGRIKLVGIAPGYNGTINILTMFCPVSNEFDENFAEHADDLFEVGSTYKIDGEVVNARVEKKVTAALGKVEGDVEYRNELIVTGSTSAYEDEKLAYDAATIELALNMYEIAQKERQNASNDDVPFGNNKPTAAGTGRSLSW